MIETVKKIRESITPTDSVPYTAVEVKALVNELFVASGLKDKGWFFELRETYSQLGSAHDAKKRITLSRPAMVTHKKTFVLEILLHEIAHALVGAGKAHGLVWKQQLLAIGGRNPRATAPDTSAEFSAMRYANRKPQNRRRSSSRQQPLFGGGTVSVNAGAVFEFRGEEYVVVRTKQVNALIKKVGDTTNTQYNMRLVHVQRLLQQQGKVSTAPALANSVSVPRVGQEVIYRGQKYEIERINRVNAVVTHKGTMVQYNMPLALIARL